MLEGSPAINEVIPFDRRSVWAAVECVERLRENHYTCAIDFQGLYKSSILAVTFRGWRAASVSIAPGRAKKARRCFIPSA